MSSDDKEKRNLRDLANGMTDDEAKRVLASGGLIIFIDWKKGVNGVVGPPENLKVDPVEIKTALESQGLRFVNDIDAGLFHFGFIYRK